MIGNRVRALLTVSRVEYGALLVGLLVGLVAKHEGANEWVVFAVWLLMALTIRWARNRGLLAHWVDGWKSPHHDRRG